ncbi:hypothetical protein BD769DRAFT_1700195 [Suillus cothurnatus]|nr:hypothetical protein BD769DRAFT_1700195 [Suillus cothurnatus]
MKRPYNNLDTSSVDDLGNDLFTITKICTIIIFLFALLAGHCTLKWHCLRSHLRRTREACVSDPTTVYTGSTSVSSVTLTNHNLLMLQTDAQHPPLSRIAYTLSGKLRLSPSQHIHLHVQLLAVGSLGAKYTAQVAASVQDLSSTIFAEVNSSMYNQSSSYTGTINARVETAQSTVNDGRFGWVNGVTTTLNTTLNNFYTDVQWHRPRAHCAGLRPLHHWLEVNVLEEALNFLNENLNIDFPTINETVLVLSLLMRSLGQLQPP